MPHVHFPKLRFEGGVLAHNLSGHYEISLQFLVLKNDPKPNFSAHFPVEISTESQNKLIFGQIITYPLNGSRSTDPELIKNGKNDKMPKFDKMSKTILFSRHQAAFSFPESTNDSK